MFFLILGLLLFLFGFVALVLLLIGARISFLAFIDAGGATLGLVIRLLMIFGGLMLVYVFRNKFE
jgi:hypothetical protein